jgi:xanthine dehydrogenase YagS FAD-binding subunit
VPVQQRRSAYIQMSEKTDFDWALVSCAAAAKLDGKKVSQARVLLGSVSNIPYEVEEANKFLEGKDLTDENLNKCADLILEKANAHAHNGYKIPIARALIRRTLLKLQA